MVTHQSTKTTEILLVEDNNGDTRLIKEAFREYGEKINLHVVDNGKNALEFIFKKGNYSHVRYPDLILLDLHLNNGMTGLEVLQEIKSNNKTVCIPVVILTSSNNEKDIMKAYDYHANCFISKPLDLSKCVSVINEIGYFWFNIVKLPQE